MPGSKNSDQFYSLLKIQDTFSGIAELSNFTEVPDDWSVVVADVQNSTIAIENGEYKAVNITGVSVITSVLNTVRPLSVPYIFGGDGATLCIPGNRAGKVRDALSATRYMARTQLGLVLRIGMVPVKDINQAGYKTLVARHRVSEYYTQAAFSGGGVEYAERIIKDDNTLSPYRLDEADNSPDADYSGLECRWDNVPSKHGEIISLIVKAEGTSMEKEAQTYNDIINRILMIYGDSDSSRPVYREGLHTTLRNDRLKYEFRTRSCKKGKFDCLKYWLFMRFQVLLGRFLMAYGIKTGGTDWGVYKDDLVRNTDFRKFDGILREVLSGTPEQRLKLTEFLEECYRNGQCYYGIHVSKAALITCLIHNRSGEHYHFIDGAEGGYTLAAKILKEQIKSGYAGNN